MTEDAEDGAMPSSPAAVRPPVFSARSVEWPLPRSLGPQTYRTLRRESRDAGREMGIRGSGMLPPPGGGGASGGDESVAAAGGVGVGGAASVSAASASSSSDPAYGGLTGLMGRVLGASSAPGGGGPPGSSPAGHQAASLEAEEDDLSSGSARAVPAPSAGCVAAGNGWVVAAVECGPPPDLAGGGSVDSVSMGSSGRHPQRERGRGGGPSPLASRIPPLRLVCRWNVRRGGGAPGALVPLPPPVREAGDHAGDASASAAAGGRTPDDGDPDFGRPVRVFVDPTGCHVLVSALNGEAYYLHSASGRARKLAGFGPNPDGTRGCRPGVSVVEAASPGPEDDGRPAAIQLGITPGSHVTAVGWDAGRGTEGSTKRIVLGTSYGELYEYSLSGPGGASDGGGKSRNPLGGKVDPSDPSDGPLDAPVLLRRLNTNPANSRVRPDGGAVGGVLLRRLSPSSGGGGGGGGRSPASSPSSARLAVLAATGGPRRRTRLHTFASPPAPSSPCRVRSAFGPGGAGTYVELPGSVGSADLVGCPSDGSFALRTETGVYRGTVERVALGGGGGSDGGGPASAAGGRAADEFEEAGLLTYGSLEDGTSGPTPAGRAPVPSSVVSTPHHLVCLHPGTDEVRFVSRVGRRTVQTERVDWSSSGDGGGPDEPEDRRRPRAAELISDARRPDQVWLRSGRCLVHISSGHEDRDVWRYTLARCVERSDADAAAGGANRPPSRRDRDGDDGGEEARLRADEARFDHARSLCPTTTGAAVVDAVRAGCQLDRGRARLAASYMARCPPALMPFDGTALRLAAPMLGRDGPRAGGVERGGRGESDEARRSLSSSNGALIAYLDDKIRGARGRGDRVACTALGAWLTELHLCEREAAAGASSSTSAPTTGPAKQARTMLRQHLSSYVRDMDPPTVLGILEGHGVGAGEVAGYAAAAGDVGAAVEAALSGEDEKNGALDALRVLNDSPIEKAEPHYHRHALTLLCRAPAAASRSFASRYPDGLSERRMLPAFMNYERRRAAVAAEDLAAERGSSPPPARPDRGPGSLVDDPGASMRYMEAVIRDGCRSRAVFNYLVSLYAGLGDEAPLFRFLSEHVPPASGPAGDGPAGDGVADVLLRRAAEEDACPVDRQFALRTVLRTGRHFRSAVRLYMGFGMRRHAVELALKVDPSLARGLARECDDPAEARRLWLMIARNAASNCGGSAAGGDDGRDVVARVVAVLKDCGPGVMSIEDVLPFLPDFAQIDQFKDEICDALASYSSKIEGYLREMTECDRTCDALRDELGRLSAVGTRIRPDARCAYTGAEVRRSNEPFYAFPSGYVVLESALRREVVPYLNERQARRVEEVEGEIARMRKLRSGPGRSPYETAKDDFDVENLQTELDGLIAAECPLTGSVMVQSIDRGFSDDDDDE